MMTPTSNRRIFMLQVAAGSASLLVATGARAEVRKLLETEPQAAALGYKDDTSTVDEKKYPKHTAAQKCTNCMIFKGVDSNGGSCHVFAARVLSGNGWCSQYAAKA